MKALCIVLLFTFSFAANADLERVQNDSHEVNLTVGTFLPWGGVPGVKDQYRMWGVNYYLPTSVWNLEFQFLTARGMGAVYHVGSIGTRLDYLIEKTLEVFLLGGLDFHSYKGASTQRRSYDYNQTFGFHLGFGGFFSITERLKLRGELKFHNGPGKTIYVGIGPSFLF